jgi:hypothetical protein
MARGHAEIGEIVMGPAEELKKIADDLEGKKVAFSPEDLRLHLSMLLSTFEDLKSKLVTLEDTEEDLITLHGLASEFYKERPFARMLGLTSNPFHHLLGIGKVPSTEDAGQVSLKSLIDGLKHTDSYIKRVEELERQIEL